MVAAAPAPLSKAAISLAPVSLRAKTRPAASTIIKYQRSPWLSRSARPVRGGAMRKRPGRARARRRSTAAFDRVRVAHEYLPDQGAFLRALSQPVDARLRVLVPAGRLPRAAPSAQGAKPGARRDRRSPLRLRLHRLRPSAERDDRD